LDDRITTSEIFIYFGTSYQKTIQCFYLDKYNKAGKLLGIPSCCDYYFKKNWETALKKYSGDMLELFLEEKVKKCFLELPWHLNVFTLYLGNSLLWHFPCSSRNCVTKKIINKRIRQLSPFENITFIPQLSKGYLLFLNKKYIYISSNGKIIFGANENKEIINCILQKSNSKKDVVNYLNGLKVEYKLIIYS
jgi:hypothetical protein